MEHHAEDLLLELIKKGDLSAFRQLYENYKDRVYHTCLRIIGDVQDAEDAVQETFINIYQNLKQFRQQSSLSTWIYKISAHVAVYKARKKKRFFRAFSQPPPADTDVGSIHPPVIDDDTLQNALNRLPLKFRTCFVLHVIEDLSYSEIAAILQIPLGTVMSRLNTARQKLKESLSSFE
jgi:RNA polymerase sigma-70 factor (ECF subfamily)